MGVPRLLWEIVKHFKEEHLLQYYSIDDKIKEVVSSCYIDFNCLIYECFSKYPKDIVFEEDIFIILIIKELEKLITNVIDITDLLYIAMDGPAPYCKMILQRYRRYKSVHNQKMLEEFKLLETKIDWNSSIHITSGTIFMTKLSKEIEKFLQYFKKNKKIQTGFSDHLEPGEGEHKIMRHIRKNKNRTKKKICIYSQDNDFIVLSSLIMEEHVFILRPDQQQDNNNDKTKEQNQTYLFFDSTKYRQAIIQENISVSLFTNANNNASDLIVYDFILLSFLGGNDFVKPLPFTKINEKGFQLLWKIYKSEINHLVYIEKNNDLHVKLR